MTNVLAWLSARNKAVLALVGAGLAFATIVVESPRASISSHEWLAGAALLAGVVGVERVTNN